MNEEMTFAQACIILRKWKELKDSDHVVKIQVDEFVKAMFIVYGGRNA